jgi:hypothetical protein
LLLLAGSKFERAKTRLVPLDTAEFSKAGDIPFLIFGYSHAIIEEILLGNFGKKQSTSK